MDTAVSKASGPGGPEDSEAQALTVCLLASGSRGNAIYVSNGTTSILLDAGLSGAEITRRLTASGVSPDSIDALVVSHEHGDHIRGIGVLSRRYRLPVYLNHKTNAAGRHLGKLHRTHHFECGRAFTINQFRIHPFSTSHDASDPAGFTIALEGLKMGIATDLGVATRMVKAHLDRCRLLVLEANHDPEMLLKGPYPWPLKQRIRSRAGHLSNRDTRKLLAELQHDRLEHVVLAHLSETNNTPQKALDEVTRALTRCQPRIIVASQDACSPLIRMTA
jgi:phosphoribosyl 1,2-cyclic phosphodiesterase